VGLAREQVERERHEKDGAEPSRWDQGGRVEGAEVHVPTAGEQPDHRTERAAGVHIVGQEVDDHDDGDPEHVIMLAPDRVRRNRPRGEIALMPG
jgi:hypothetical protein